MDNETDITFENGLKAHLNFNPLSKETPYTTQLYTSDDTFITSAPCDPDNFEPTATGLMYGYFSGWSWCKTMIVKNINEAIKVNAPR